MPQPLPKPCRHNATWPADKGSKAPAHILRAAIGPCRLGNCIFSRTTGADAPAATPPLRLAAARSACAATDTADSLIARCWHPTAPRC